MLGQDRAGRSGVLTGRLPEPEPGRGGLGWLAPLAGWVQCTLHTLGAGHGRTGVRAYGRVWVLGPATRNLTGRAALAPAEQRESLSASARSSFATRFSHPLHPPHRGPGPSPRVTTTCTLASLPPWPYTLPMLAHHCCCCMLHPSRNQINAHVNNQQHTSTPTVPTPGLSRIPACGCPTTLGLLRYHQNNQSKQSIYASSICCLYVLHWARH